MSSVSVTMKPGNSSRLSRLVLGLLLAAFALAALAEHEADHRYTVKGFVLDAEERPRSDVEVIVSSEEGVLGRDTTDGSGRYSIRLHLHNTDLGKSLIVKAGEQATTIEVTFDPGDREAERAHNLNFVGDDTSGEDLVARSLPTWWYVVVGVIILFIVVRGAVNAVKARRKVHRKGEAPRRKRRKSPGRTGGKRRG